MVYDESVSVETVAKHIADQCQHYTQYAGARPIGVALIIGGVDQNGNSLPAWPKDTGSNIIGSISFSDLDSDGTADVIANNDNGTIFNAKISPFRLTTPFSVN